MLKTVGHLRKMGPPQAIVTPAKRREDEDERRGITIREETQGGNRFGASIVSSWVTEGNSALSL
jgi:hypothetical protein